MKITISVEYNEADNTYQVVSIKRNKIEQFTCSSPDEAKLKATQLINQNVDNKQQSIKLGDVVEIKGRDGWIGVYEGVSLDTNPDGSSQKRTTYKIRALADWYQNNRLIVSNLGLFQATIDQISLVKSGGE